MTGEQADISVATTCRDVGVDRHVVRDRNSFGGQDNVATGVVHNRTVDGQWAGGTNGYVFTIVVVCRIKDFHATDRAE